jgi:hypothetical protein
VAELPRHFLLSAVPVAPDLPGQVRVLLTCDCGKVTDFTYEAGAAGETGRSYTCGGCRTSHWFTAGRSRAMRKKNGQE